MKARDIADLLEIIALWSVVLLLGSCAAIVVANAADLRPAAISFELAHTSHVSQHFGPDPTNYGYNAALLTARWEYQRIHLEVSEGAVLDQCVEHSCGGLWGPRELFTARVGVNLWTK